MRSMFHNIEGMFRIPKTNMILDVAVEMYDKGYTNINMVVGSDRVQEFKTILNKYNNVKSRHGFYDFLDIKVTSAGERDQTRRCTGMSASKMKKCCTRRYEII